MKQFNHRMAAVLSSLRRKRAVHRTRRWRFRSPIRARFAFMKANAAARGQKWELSRGDFLAWCARYDLEEAIRSGVKVRIARQDKSKPWRFTNLEPVIG